MKIVVLHGQNHKGSTDTITRLFLARLSQKGTEVLEFQTNHISPCTGCFTCIIKGEHLCPHSEAIQPIVKAIENADIVIAESPNYCMEMSGQLKILFDHMAYRWLSHRPHPAMKHKIGLAISTTAGIGAAGVTKSIKRQMFYWGIPALYRMSVTVGAMSWADVKAEKKEKIEKEVNRTANRMLKKIGHVKPDIKSRTIFQMMKLMQKMNNWSALDKKHWEENGWI